MNRPKSKITMLYTKQYSKIRITVLIDSSEIYFPFPSLEYSNKDAPFKHGLTLILYCLFIGVSWR